MERPGGRGLGATLGLASVLMWGTQFTVSKVLYRHIDAFEVTTVRYLFGGILLLGILAVVEGPQALQLGEHARRAWLLGLAGVVGSTLVAYIGLQHTRPQNAALMVALQPLLTAIVLRVTGRGKLPRSTAIAIGVAFLGSLLVIGRGDPRSFVESGVGWGVILCFFSQFAWVMYTIELPSLTGWSILRTTALTSATGGVLVTAITAVVIAVGWSNPHPGALGGSAWLLVWMVIGPTVASIFAWNKGRMLLGAQDIAIFMYLIPVVAFVMEALRGYQPGVVEMLAVLTVVAALVGDNIAQRRARAGTAAHESVVATTPAP